MNKQVILSLLMFAQLCCGETPWQRQTATLESEFAKLKPPALSLAEIVAILRKDKHTVEIEELATTGVSGTTWRVKATRYPSVVIYLYGGLPNYDKVLGREVHPEKPIKAIAVEHRSASKTGENWYKTVWPPLPEK